MVFAVRCPNQQCQKYMLVEDEKRGQTVPCLICKTPIRAGSPSSSNPETKPTTRPTTPPPKM